MTSYPKLPNQSSGRVEHSSAIIGPVASRFLATRSAPELIVIGLVLVAAVGALDQLTGREISFSVFYLIPVACISWFGRRLLGVIICITSAVVWLVVDYTSGQQYTHTGIPYWNAAVRFGFFISVAVLLESLHRALEFQESLAQSDALTGIMNARAFRERVHALLSLSARRGHPLTIGYIDVDNFKHINDDEILTSRRRQ